MEMQKYKNEYNEFLKKIFNRKGVVELSSYLEKHGFFSAPASTKYHLCFEGGLLIHSLNVTKLSLKLKEIFLPTASDESIILCALFHDAHKVTDGFGNTTYIKNEGSDKDKQPFLWNKDQMNFSSAQKSLLIISKFVDLTQDEMQAIAYHDGPFIPAWEDIKSDPYPLTLLLHFADMWSCWIVEKQKDKNFYTKKFLQDI